ncbi:MAG: SgcJ/EcaC family oxidoreductase [Eikenella sp.]|nr:SgcJ/EcaC family oxidoreductase [Eikenella sp.]
MNRLSASLLAGFLLCAPLLPAAQAETVPSASASATTVADEQLHDELRTLRDTMQNALNQRQLDTLLDNVTDDVVFSTMNGDRIIGKDGIRQYFQQMMEGDAAVVKNIGAEFEADALSRLYGGDTAVAFGRSRDRYELNNGETWTVTPQWSATMVRQDGRWLIANFHYSVNMFDNPVLTAQRTWLLGGGLAAALLLGALGFWLGRRTRR